jgi:hypothetical protein
MARTMTAFLAGLLATTGATVLRPAPAHAIGIKDVKDFVGYAQAAYSAYQFLFGNELTLQQAVDQITSAITAAQVAIVAEIDAMAAADIQSCARAAVIDSPTIGTMTETRLQQYAADTTRCVTDAWAKIPQATDKAAVDEMGFALNIVGPIALAARSEAFGAGNSSTLTLRDTLVQANKSNLVRLLPSCGGVRGEIVNGRQEVALVCTAYNGDRGDAGTIFIGAGAPLPSNIDYSTGITQAMARTSYPVSVGALDGLFPDPAVAAPGDQIGYFNATASLQLAASGGAAPYTWKITGLPPGLTGNSSGQITGTFSQAGAWTVRAQVTDTQAQVATVTFSWTVREIPMILAGTLGDRTMMVGTSVTATPGVTGGTPPYTWTVTGLPAGLVADANGHVTGVVQASPVTNTVTFTATDANAQRASRTVVWTVRPAAACWSVLTDHRVTQIPDLATVNLDNNNGCTGNASATAHVSLNISHTYIGNLVIDLIAPSGRVYNLHNRAGGDADSLVTTVNLNLSGEPMMGLWRLRIRDAAARDSGQLNDWRLQLL